MRNLDVVNPAICQLLAKRGTLEHNNFAVDHPSDWLFLAQIPVEDQDMITRVLNIELPINARQHLSHYPTPWVEFFLAFHDH